MMPVSEYSTNFYTTDTSSTQGVLRGSVQEDTQSTSTLDVQSLAKDDFLKLLLAQLKNQDPLNPADNTEFVAQLAQFSTLEQLTTMNSTLEQTLEYNRSITESINSSMMVNFFGKYVYAESDVFAYDGKNPVTLQFELDSDVSNGKLEILDKSGEAVSTISFDEMNAGTGAVEWDGMKNTGVLAGAGMYTYKVTAYDLVGNEAEVSPVFAGKVEGISYKDGKAYLDVEGVLVPFDKVKHIVDSVE